MFDWNNGANHFPLRDILRVTADKSSNEHSSADKIAAAQRLDHIVGFLIEAAHGEASENPVSGDKKTTQAQGDDDDGYDDK